MTKRIPSRRGPFRRPVARRARTVLLAGKDRQRRAAIRVLHRLRRRSTWAGAFGQQARHAAFGARGKLVAQAHIGERATHHHLMIAAAAAVAVEVAGLHAMLGQVLAGRAVQLDRACGGDVVGGDAVAQHGQHARGVDVLQPAQALRPCRRSTGPCGCRSSPAPTHTCHPAGNFRCCQFWSPSLTVAY